MNKLNQITIDSLNLMIPKWYWMDGKREVECNMSTYNYNGDRKSKDPEHLCGTVCCGLGVVPLTIPPVEEDYAFNSGHIFGYTRYSQRVFPSLSVEPFDQRGSKWSWLFSSEWKTVDDTFRGVALRAQYLLDNYNAVNPKLVKASTLNKRRYMFNEKYHDRTIDYLEAERKGE